MVLGYHGSSGPISGANRENIQYFDAESKRSSYSGTYYRQWTEINFLSNISQQLCALDFSWSSLISLHSGSGRTMLGSDSKTATRLRPDQPLESPTCWSQDFDGSILPNLVVAFSSSSLISVLISSLLSSGKKTFFTPHFFAALRLHWTHRYSHTDRVIYGNELFMGGVFYVQWALQPKKRKLNK